VAVGIGPGSYTGVRMGVALAKALAHALELPLVGIAAPEAMAAALPARPGAGLCVLQEARADEVYATALRKQDRLQATELAPTRVLRLEQALAAAQDLLGGPPEVFCGNAARRYAGQVQACCGTARLADPRYDTPRAGVMAEMAAGRLGEADPEAAFTLRPRYARVSQAERQHGIDLQLA